MKGKHSKYDYGECHVCGEVLRERRVNQDFWIKGKLVVIEKVPAGVCPQCGEKVVRADTGRNLAELLGKSSELRKVRRMTVPVLRFVKKIA